LNDYAQNIQNSDLNGITLRRGLLYPFNYGSGDVLRNWRYVFPYRALL